MSEIEIDPAVELGSENSGDDSSVCDDRVSSPISDIQTPVKSKNQMFVSGWEDDDEGIEEEQNPSGAPEKEILWASEKGNLPLVIKLLQLDKKLVHTKDKDGYTPLHRACYSNEFDVAQRLLQSGADPNSTTEFKWTPLHSACQWNNYKCAGLLLQHGADVNAVTEGGQTPLHVAASTSHCKETVTLLLMDENVKPNVRNVSGDTAADIARRMGKYFYLFEMGHEAININKSYVVTFKAQRVPQKELRIDDSS